MPDSAIFVSHAAPGLESVSVGVVRNSSMHYLPSPILSLLSFISKRIEFVAKLAVKRINLAQQTYQRESLR